MEIIMLAPGVQSHRN